MYDVLNLTIPFFGVIALGAFSRAIGFFDADMGLKLARFAFYFILPPFLFLSIIAAPVEELFNLGFSTSHPDSMSGVAIGHVADNGRLSA